MTGRSDKSTGASGESVLNTLQQLHAVGGDWGQCRAGGVKVIQVDAASAVTQHQSQQIICSGGKMFDLILQMSFLFLEFYFTYLLIKRLIENLFIGIRMHEG